MRSLKPISTASIPAALSKAGHYRSLNQPEEAESICKDILAIAEGHQPALRLLGLSITDQFTGKMTDRYAEADQIFQQLTDPYERAYYHGIALERRAKMQLHTGYTAHIVRPMFEKAMQSYAEAENLRPAGNDDALLRWNRCVRLLEELPKDKWEEEGEGFDVGDSAPSGGAIKGN